MAWVAALVLLPVLVILWLTESKSTRINRLKKNGATWKQIGDRYAVSASTARRWSMVQS
ncbi:hypothetical protein [Synechococcus sp. SYN20]|uniref:hypothetical protein n=1 Tax=Synechococcus sp. SYN20 TaxID=1050714 RepID=UPI0016450024|nr:hypothetical protein [Synechococcus sp. SYN20]